MGLVTASQFNLTPDVVGSVSRGLSLGEQFRQQQLQKEQDQFLRGGGLQDPNALQNAAKLGLDFQQNVARSLGLQDQITGQINQAQLTEAADFAFRIKDMSAEQQNEAINRRIERLESEGRDATQTRELLSMPIESRAGALEGVQLAALPNEERLKFMTGQLSRDQLKVFAPRPNEKGGLSLPQFNQRTGEVQFIEIPGSVAETPTEKRTQEFIKKQKEEELKTTEAAKRDVQKANIARKQGFIDNGIDAADSVANIKRSIQLLDTIDTGGFDNAALRAKQIFGIESADEAELSAGLGKAILAQLKPLFGAAFTAQEGQRLERIEAGFGKSTAGNKRLLEQTLKIADRAARRGLAAAEDVGETFTANEIRKALEFNLEPQQAEGELTAEEQRELEELEKEFGGQ